MVRRCQAAGAGIFSAVGNSAKGTEARIVGDLGRRVLTLRAGAPQPSQRLAVLADRLERQRQILGRDFFPAVAGNRQLTARKLHAVAMGIGRRQQRGRLRAACLADLGDAQICQACRPEAAALLTAPYAHSNRMELARRELTVARDRWKEVAAEDLALAFEAVGEHSEALAWLRRARAQGEYTATEIANDPRFSALRRITNG